MSLASGYNATLKGDPSEVEAKFLDYRLTRIYT